jgi:hypothetical protein
MASASPFAILLIFSALASASISTFLLSISAGIIISAN